MQNFKSELGTRNNRILVIDDNPEIHNDFRKVLCATVDAGASDLESAEAAIFGDDPAPPTVGGNFGQDFEIDSAFQGQEGLKMVEQALAEGRPYAMAFVDVRMPPGWDGVETILQLWKKYPELQVVICTAYSDYSWADITRNLGSSDSLVVLKKPFDNIEALQLAHALTKKWLVTRQAGARMADLDMMVQQRTVELEAANERFSKAFRASPLPMGICRTNSARFLEVNESFARLFGIAHTAAVNHSDSELGIWAHSSDQDKFWHLLRETGRVHEMKCQLRINDGPVREALAFGEDILLNHEHCALVVFHDMTEQLELQSQLRQSQKMEAVGQLASGVAHDFNNLLTVIRGHADLRGGAVNLDPELSESFKQIGRATERAAGLTRQLLAFSRRHITRPKAIDLNELIGNVREMAESLVSEQIKIDCELARNLPMVHADASNLEQVLINLIVNAKDAMTEGGRLTISTAVCEVSADEARLNPDAHAGTFICLGVKDDGSGIDPVILNRIFEPFFTTKPMGRGTGMGLAMVYGIVKEHHGWITVTSELGTGSTFKVLLPISKDRVAAVDKKFPKAGDPSGNETILLVEDDPSLRAITAEILKAAGYRVLEASSGVDALRAWFSNDGNIDLLLSDVIMPEGMTGRKLAEKLLARKPSLKVILTSGHASEIRDHDAYHGPGRFIAKPYTAAIVSAVRSCLDEAPVAG